MPINHTVRSFDEELGYLEAKIAKMGTFASEMIEEAVNAVINNDLDLAKKVISDDMFLDETEREIDEKSVAIIAKRQPMAVDLREIIGAMRIAADLERVGDMGKNIAKRAAAIVESRQPASLYHGLQSFATLTLNQLKEVLDAYASRSLERIDAVRNRDEEIDAMYTSLFRELLTYMMEDPRNITACTHLLFCAKNIERIGDHATNIAEALHYIMTGTYLSTDRPRDDTTYKVGADGKTAE
ncbi:MULTISPECIES: phosphate signaling complex protein PhoU [Bartonella]|uniref:phosphate signaling complex protein PhoU n=1 Tax=Bartonella TaxID=773 RepID=UPI0018DB9FD9|nr:MULTISPECIES: phosphate signaling complex protein PhoU [Bartonella]MBH9986703.1 phosphate signaling complex protein PhoU [Bartonella apis]MBI0169924.1 phosphate signaling complex protein PhoU [Bartonella sp. W8167]MBI0171247.1 phosphate signaling complex protein PhoU [Bartonella sp. W8151]MBI0176098.1 phosphate signaling complex protein PhoU [Bartonella apis]